MTIYNYQNALGATVHDIESGSKITGVESVNTDSGVVRCFHQPCRLNHLGELDAFDIAFESIYPITGCGTYPLAFHCYGRRDVVGV